MSGYRLVEERARALGLTPREGEVLLLVLEGLTSKEIGARLGISDSTVRTYLARMMIRLDARGQAQLAAKAIDLGIVEPEAGSGP